MGEPPIFIHVYFIIDFSPLILGRHQLTQTHTRRGGAVHDDVNCGRSNWWRRLVRCDLKQRTQTGGEGLLFSSSSSIARHDVFLLSSVSLSYNTEYIFICKCLVMLWIVCFSNVFLNVFSRADFLVFLWRWSKQRIWINKIYRWIEWADFERDLYKKHTPVLTGCADDDGVLCGNFRVAPGTICFCLCQLSMLFITDALDPFHKIKLYIYTLCMYNINLSSQNRVVKLMLREIKKDGVLNL